MSEERFQQIRMVEALIFASTDPVSDAGIKSRLPEGVDFRELMDEVAGLYANRGVNLVRLDGKWIFRTAPDLGSRLQIEAKVTRRLSCAALETLAVIAYHQPVTRAEVEEVRGVALSKGTLIRCWRSAGRPKGRRRPCRPDLGDTDAFLGQFGLTAGCPPASRNCARRPVGCPFGPVGPGRPGPVRHRPAGQSGQS
jgi:segregation and condensation protein B